MDADARRILLPGLLLGLGLGGFVDGIVFHQLLQWHHMLTDAGRFGERTVVRLEDNTLADGLFHAATWALVVAGVFLLRGRGHVAWRPLAGLMLAGWGVFNLAEGVVDHHILGIHHVRDDVAEPLPWDLGVLGLGALLVVVGHLLARRPVPGTATTS